jgi:hypothetical protein
MPDLNLLFLLGYYFNRTRITGMEMPCGAKFSFYQGIKYLVILVLAF